MNYQHAYHAGGFADVLKHVVLVGAILALNKKNTPYCYLDTHAGLAYYDLSETKPNKTKEYLNGITKIINAAAPPLLVQNYLNCIHRINNFLSKEHYSSLRFYPGSTLIARSLIAPKDRIVACELNTETYQALHQYFQGDKSVAIHHLNGFQGLKAFLPPKERRGLILIDPPYEAVTEYTDVLHGLKLALQRFETGVYLLWYPIKDKKHLAHFHLQLKNALKKEILIVELNVYPDLGQQLTGSGVAIVNAPWQLGDQIKDTLPWLYQTLATHDKAGFTLLTLK